MASALSIRSLVYGLVWAGTLHLCYQLGATGALSWSLFLPESMTILLGCVSGSLFDGLSRRYHWLLPALGLALLHAELAAWIGYHGPLALKLIPPALLASTLAAFFAQKTREPKEIGTGRLLQLLMIGCLIAFQPMLGNNSSGFNSVSTYHRTTSPDGLWAARVKRGGPLFGSRVDAIVVRPNRDWFGLFTVRIAEEPFQDITDLRWVTPQKLLALSARGDASQKDRHGLRLTILPAMAGDP